jgi:hypothetical protein
MASPPRRTPATIIARARLLNALDKSTLATAWPEQADLLRRAADELPNVSDEVKGSLNDILKEIVEDMEREARQSTKAAIRDLLGPDGEQE